MTDPMTPDVALDRLAQYREHKGLTVATYDSGAERALHEIATTLATEVDRLRAAEQRVRALHSAEPDAKTCAECQDDWLEGQCPTIRALDGES